MTRGIHYNIVCFDEKKMWCENTGGDWYYKTLPNGTWGPPGGTKSSPLVSYLQFIITAKYWQFRKNQKKKQTMKPLIIGNFFLLYLGQSFFAFLD
jgi:hypothetical protein